MIRKIAALVLACCLPGACFAQGIPMADTQLNTGLLSRCTEIAPGECTLVYSVQAQALKNAFVEKLSGYHAQGTVCFYTAVCVDPRTEVCAPVLEILYAGNTALQAGSVSIAVGGKRMDAVCSCETAGSGNRTYEICRVYPGENERMLLAEAAAAGQCELALYGKTRFAKTISASANQANSADLSYLSLNALAFPEGSPDFDAYAFGTESRALFRVLTGANTVSAVYTIGESDGYVFDPCGTVSADQKSVKTLSALLAEKGFLAGEALQPTAAGLCPAIKAAQRYYGFVCTGYADANLIASLTTGVSRTEAGEPESAPELMIGDLEFSLRRAWFADAFETTVPGGGKTVSCSENTFLLADGIAVNSGKKALSLGWEISAVLIYCGEYEFPASIYTESDSGKALSSTLSVLAKERIVIACEIPEYLSRESSSWQLRLKCGAQELTLDME